MKFKVDKAWGIGGNITRALLAPNEHLQYRLICTGGRTLALLLADTPAHAAPIFAACGVSIWGEGLQSSRGLCTMLYQKPKRGVCLIDKNYDGVVGIFNTDQGFRRSKQSIVVTAGHEALHAARVLAAKDLGLPVIDAVLTREYEEAVAEWTGYLTKEFLLAMGLLSI